MAGAGDQGGERSSGSQGFGTGTGLCENADQDRIGGALEGSGKDPGFDTAPLQGDAVLEVDQIRAKVVACVRRRMIWNRRPDFRSEGLSSSVSGYAA